MFFKPTQKCNCFLIIVNEGHNRLWWIQFCLLLFDTCLCVWETVHVVGKNAAHTWNAGICTYKIKYLQGANSVMWIISGMR